MLETIRLLIVAAALSHGQSPGIMYRVALCESRGDRYAYNAAGPYVGLYQLGPPKQHQFVVRQLAQGLVPDLYDPAQQANFTAERFTLGEQNEWGCI